MKPKVFTCLLLLGFSLLFSFAKGQCNASFTYTVSGDTLTVTSTGTGGTPQWDFGDGYSGFGANTSHIYQGSGTYTVCVLMLNFFGAICDSACSVVVIGSGISSCNAQFTFNTSGNLVGFTDQSTSSFPVQSYFWSFGDGSTSTLSSPSHFYPGYGFWYPCLTITTLDSCVSTYCDTVYLPAPISCVADFNVTVNATTANFTNISTGAYASVLWSFGDGSTSTVGTPSHIYTAAGSYMACLTLYDSLGSYCDSICKTVTIANGPSCTANFTSSTLGGGNYSFIDQSSGTANIMGWAWDFGDGATSSFQNPNHTFLPGTYIVCLSILTQDSCTDTYCDTLFYSGNGCSANWQSVVTGNDVVFTDLSTSNLGQSVIGWNWVFGDGGTSSAQNPTHTYPGPGNWFPCLYITTSDSCEDSYCDSVVTNGPLAISAGWLQHFSIYPNPTEGQVTVSFLPSENGILEIEWLNPIGQVMGRSADHVVAGYQYRWQLDLGMDAKGWLWLRIKLNGTVMGGKAVFGI